VIFRGGEFSTGEMGNFHPALTSRYRRWLKRPPSHGSMRATGASAVATIELEDAL